MQKEIARCQGMLSNPNFVNKAPEAKVNAEKEKLQKYEEMMEKVKNTAYSDGKLIKEHLDEIV